MDIYCKINSLRNSTQPKKRFTQLGDKNLISLFHIREELI